MVFWPGCLLVTYLPTENDATVTSMVLNAWRSLARYHRNQRTPSSLTGILIKHTVLLQTSEPLRSISSASQEPPID